MERPGRSRCRTRAVGARCSGGSAGFVEGALAGRQADVAYLGVGQLGVMDEDYIRAYWAQTVTAVGAKRVVLTHWDDFFRGLDQPLRALPYAGDDLDVTMRIFGSLAAEQGIALHLPTLWRREDPLVRPAQHVSPLDQVVVLVTGLAAGILTSTVGVASLLSFPVLVAVGLPPVVANASNTIGMTPGALSGSWGYRSELREHPRVAAIVPGTCGVGSVAGAVLLLPALPPAVFEGVVPWLILGTCLLVGIQPRLSARLRARRGSDAADRLHVSPVTGGLRNGHGGVRRLLRRRLRRDDAGRARAGHGPALPGRQRPQDPGHPGREPDRERDLRVRRRRRLARGGAAGIGLGRGRLRRVPPRAPDAARTAAHRDRHRRTRGCLPALALTSSGELSATAARRQDRSSELRAQSMH
ncbi:sulfite exporter TauE/SafE family protein [Nocardioides sp. B-3]|uniref:sulfite exporter TauE/SafE family protein n=1 Tax=Nocardioides sp. B-3 TaxID=2895565 RepID=UPI003FA56F6B